MTAYQQMGHHSTNLVFDAELSGYDGAILSPVNEDERQVRDLLARVRSELPALETVFDPQLYFPNSNRGQLRTWSHFPADVDTADMTSSAWWTTVVESLCAVVRSLQPHAVCSPAVVPRVFSSNEPFVRMVEVGNQLRAALEDVPVLQTVLVGMDDMTVAHRAEVIASIVSRSRNDRVFLVVCSDVDPRRELADVEGLKGIMRLIKFLEEGGQKVLVGFCSSEMVLWKAAGATACATGKFFNLRRFTRSRFEEPAGGGGQLPYWFEERLFAHLRESDVVRVERAGGFSDATNRNPFTAQIREQMTASQAWVSTGWRQYLWWFADFESRANLASVRAGLRAADGVWREFEDNDVLMEERQNDGAWVRQWRRAVAEFKSA